MKKMRHTMIRVFLALVVLAFLLPVGAASAHGSTKVGNYTIEVGFRIEPAYQGFPNGLDLIVTDSSANNKRVTGLEDTLQAEVIFGASKKTLKIEPVDEVDGEYTAAIIPTELGDYTWHIFGKIADTPVDISMTSSPTTFASVVPLSADAFPDRGSTSAITLQGEITRARATATIGLVVGVIGVLIALASLGLAINRNRK